MKKLNKEDVLTALFAGLATGPVAAWGSFTPAPWWGDLLAVGAGGFLGSILYSVFKR